MESMSKRSRGAGHWCNIVILFETVCLQICLQKKGEDSDAIYRLLSTISSVDKVQRPAAVIVIRRVDLIMFALSQFQTALRYNVAF